MSNPEQQPDTLGELATDQGQEVRGSLPAHGEAYIHGLGRCAVNFGTETVIFTTQAGRQETVSKQEAEERFMDVPCLPPQNT
jgi:hypothetical protein